MGELVFFAIKPTNISVLPDAGVGARIYALLNVVKGMAEIEMLALNSKESFENNKAFYRQRANEEELPVIRKLLEQDSKHLDRIQVLMASSREFYILVRLQGKKESDVFSYLSRIEKSIKDNGFTVHRATEEDLKRMLGVYFEHERDHRAVRGSRRRTLGPFRRIRGDITWQQTRKKLQQGTRRTHLSNPFWI